MIPQPLIPTFWQNPTGRSSRSSWALIRSPSVGTGRENPGKDLTTVATVTVKVVHSSSVRSGQRSVSHDERGHATSGRVDRCIMSPLPLGEAPRSCSGMLSARLSDASDSVSEVSEAARHLAVLNRGSEDRGRSYRPPRPRLC